MTTRRAGPSFERSEQHSSSALIGALAVELELINGRGKGLDCSKKTFVSRSKSNGSSLTIGSRTVADIWMRRCKGGGGYPRSYQRP